MNVFRWIQQNTASLRGKTVAITGSTGGLGTALCRHIASLGANLILIDRNRQRSLEWKNILEAEFIECRITCITVDLADMESVYHGAQELLALPFDVFLHNAGAYSIPRCRCDTGWDNVFQINFASPYYLIRQLLPKLQACGGRVVVVGSIAHRYSKTKTEDIDFATERRASLVYGNAKRYLMFSMYDLCRRYPTVPIAVTHPGITFTNITAHYPKWIFALIKYPMKVLFAKTQKASLSILQGLFWECAQNEWIGPARFDIWGYPKKKKLRSVSEAEQRAICDTAETVYQALIQQAKAPTPKD